MAPVCFPALVSSLARVYSGNGKIWMQWRALAFELDASIDITDSFSLRAGYAYIDAEVSANGAAVALDGLRPAQVAKHHANASLIYDGDVVRGSISIRYVGQQFEDDLNTRSLGRCADGWCAPCLRHF